MDDITIAGLFQHAEDPEKCEQKPGRKFQAPDLNPIQGFPYRQAFPKACGDHGDFVALRGKGFGQRFKKLFNPPDIGIIQFEYKQYFHSFISFFIS